MAWTDIIPWPIDHAHDRLARMFDTHHLAIACRDRDWLLQLHDAWDAAPWKHYRPQPLRAQGEIALALAPDGPRAPGWSPAEVEELLEEGHLSPHIPSEHAWALLAAGDRDGARDALVAHDERLPIHILGELATADEVTVRRIVAAPDRILRVESRALHALLATLSDPDRAAAVPVAVPVVVLRATEGPGAGPAGGVSRPWPTTCQGTC